MLRSAILAAWLLVSGCALASGQGGSNSAPEALKVDPAAAGWNVAGLAEVVSYAQSQKTTGFVIIDNKRIIADFNWPLAADTPPAFRATLTHGVTKEGVLLEDVASQQKSFVAILAGVAIDRKLLEASRPVSSYLGAGWTKASAEQEIAITVRHLLEMTSGLKEDFTYEAAAGSKFFYNTPVYAALKPVLEKASGQTLDAITQDWLAGPAGMKDTAWRARVNISSGNPTGLATTARDIARMGQVVLDHGKADDGKRIISQSQLEALFARTTTNPAYGRLWWLNGSDYWLAPAGRRTEGQLIAAAPKDLLAAQGAQDRKLYVVPSRKLVVVRTGPATPDGREFNQQLWTRLMQALPRK